MPTCILPVALLFSLVPLSHPQCLTGREPHLGRAKVQVVDAVEVDVLLVPPGEGLQGRGGVGVWVASWLVFVCAGVFFPSTSFPPHQE